MGGWSVILMSAVRAFHIVLRASPAKKALFIAVMQAIAAGMLAHAASYAGAPVDLNTFKNQVGNLVSAQQLARTRAPGAAAARDEALLVVAASAELLRAFVEQLCNASPEQGVTLAQGAAMQIASRPVRARVPLRARQGSQPGTVILCASVALLVTGKGGRYFSWESSVDGGKTWVAATPTPKATTTLSGLPVLTQCMFRVCVTTNKSGQGPWTDPVPFLVH